MPKEKKIVKASAGFGGITSPEYNNLKTGILFKFAI